MHASTWCDILEGAKYRFCGGGYSRAKGRTHAASGRSFQKPGAPLARCSRRCASARCCPTEFRVRAERTATCPRLVCSHGTRMDSVSFKGSADRKTCCSVLVPVRRRKKKVVKSWPCASVEGLPEESACYLEVVVKLCTEPLQPRSAVMRGHFDPLLLSGRWRSR